MGTLLQFPVSTQPASHAADQQKACGSRTLHQLLHKLLGAGRGRPTLLRPTLLRATLLRATRPASRCTSGATASLSARRAAAAL